MWLAPWFPRRCAGCGDEADERLCLACRTPDPRVAAPIEGVRVTLALVGYDSGVARALRTAKYGGDRALMLHLAAWYARHAAPLAVGCDLIVPTPSTWTRRAARGFAPAAVLAASLASRTGLPVVHALSLAPGARQAGVAGAARRGNLVGRLRARREAPGRVLLVDDVTTTGATLAASARELLGGSSGSVHAVVLCATDPPTKDPVNP